MDADSRIRLASRILAVLAFLSFLSWLFVATRYPSALLVSIAFAATAYGFYLWYQRRNPLELAGYGAEGEDRVEEGSDVAVSPGVSAAGIHLSFETRSRWRRKR